VLPGLSSHPKMSDRPAGCNATKITILVDSWRLTVDNFEERQEWSVFRIAFELLTK
jgi:hypothetical protein